MADSNPLLPPSDGGMVDPTLPEGDKAIVVIRRHVFGLIVLYVQVIVAVALALGLLFFLAGSLGASADHKTALMLVSIIVVSLAVIYMIIVTALYRDNRWIVTDDNIIQVLRIGLFKIHTSGLSMANIEDVTSDRIGIFSQLFGFGVLKAETAGEKSNFHFIYCPKSDTYAKIILDAREKFINDNPMAAAKADMSLTVPRGTRSV